MSNTNPINPFVPDDDWLAANPMPPGPRPTEEEWREIARDHLIATRDAEEAGMRLVLHFDGATEPVNPGGTGSFGYVIHGHTKHDPLRGYGTLPAAPDVTNNLCEWLALEEGLKAVAACKTVGDAIGHLRVYGDSLLVVNQITGKWQCKAPHLAAARDRCHAILDRLGVPWRAEWVSRDQNQEADALTVSAWEEFTGKPFPVRSR